MEENKVETHNPSKGIRIIVNMLGFIAVMTFFLVAYKRHYLPKFITSDITYSLATIAFLMFGVIVLVEYYLTKNWKRAIIIGLTICLAFFVALLILAYSLFQL
ncbi:MAG: hypothetical protein ABH874_05490 [Methanobacteriota archaeon]